MNLGEYFKRWIFLHKWNYLNIFVINTDSIKEVKEKDFNHIVTLIKLISDYENTWKKGDHKNNYIKRMTVLTFLQVYLLDLKRKRKNIYVMKNILTQC